jgi:glutamate dehydrogenase (NADP+)
MLTTRNQTLKDKICLVSGSGNVAQYTTEKLIQLGGKVVTLSDSTGYIYDEKGIDVDKLAYVKYLKNVKRGRIRDYAEKYPEAVYTEFNPAADHSPLWNHRADCAFPSATQNEINGKDAQNLVNNGVQVVCEGANMPTTLEGIDIFLDQRILFAPGKAANAGGVAVSGLEMAQNAMRIKWTSQEVEERLKNIMQHIHRECLAASKEYGTPGNYVNGANIAGFVKVAEAMMDQGVV